MQAGLYIRRAERSAHRQTRLLQSAPFPRGADISRIVSAGDYARRFSRGYTNAKPILGSIALPEQDLVLLT